MFDLRCDIWNMDNILNINEDCNNKKYSDIVRINASKSISYTQYINDGIDKSIGYMEYTMRYIEGFEEFTEKIQQKIEISDYDKILNLFDVIQNSISKNDSIFKKIKYFILNFNKSVTEYTEKDFKSIELYDEYYNILTEYKNSTLIYSIKFIEIFKRY